MNHVDGLPRYTERKQLTERDLELARINNQFILEGTDPSKVADNIIIFLEYVAHGGSLQISDKDDTTIGGTVTETLDLTKAPMRLDGGVKLTGTVLLAKGFYIVR